MQIWCIADGFLARYDDFERKSGSLVYFNGEGVDGSAYFVDRFLRTCGLGTIVYCTVER